MPWNFDATKKSNSDISLKDILYAPARAPEDPAEDLGDNLASSLAFRSRKASRSTFTSVVNTRRPQACSLTRNQDFFFNR